MLKYSYGFYTASENTNLSFARKVLCKASYWQTVTDFAVSMLWGLKVFLDFQSLVCLKYLAELAFQLLHISKH